MVSGHEHNGAGRVSRGSGPQFPMDSGEQQAWEGVTRWVRGLPDSPILGLGGCRAIRLRGLP